MQTSQVKQHHQHHREKREKSTKQAKQRRRNLVAARLNDLRAQRPAARSSALLRNRRSNVESALEKSMEQVCLRSLFVRLHVRVRAHTACTCVYARTLTPRTLLLLASDPIHIFHSQLSRAFSACTRTHTHLHTYAHTCTHTVHAVGDASGEEGQEVTARQGGHARLPPRSAQAERHAAAVVQHQVLAPLLSQANQRPQDPL